MYRKKRARAFRKFGSGWRKQPKAAKEGLLARRAGAKRERDVRRRQQSRPSEELDPLAHAGHGAVSEDPEHTAIADDPMDSERRISWYGHEALRLPRSALPGS